MYFGRCVVTGPRGFLGPYIIGALLEHGNQVVPLERGQSPEGVYDLLVHAAPVPLGPYLGYARRTIVLSSGAVVARSSGYLKGYADDKRSLEADARYDEAQIARIYSVLGPGVSRHRHFAATQFLEQALSGGPVVVRDGAIRSYLHPADVASALLTILAHGDGEPYDVGGESAIEVAHLGKQIAIAAGVACHLAQPEFPKDIYLPNLTRLHRLGWRQTIGLDAMIEQTLASLKAPA